MTLEKRDYDDDDIPDTHPITPTRILQIRFIGFVNALFNYIQWLIEQNTIRKGN